MQGPRLALDPQLKSAQNVLSFGPYFNHLKSCNGATSEVHSPVRQRPSFSPTGKVTTPPPWLSQLRLPWSVFFFFNICFFKLKMVFSGCQSEAPWTVATWINPSVQPPAAGSTIMAKGSHESTIAYSIEEFNLVLTSDFTLSCGFSYGTLSSLEPQIDTMDDDPSLRMGQYFQPTSLEVLPFWWVHVGSLYELRKYHIDDYMLTT